MLFESMGYFMFFSGFMFSGQSFGFIVRWLDDGERLR
jgi:hypothetical protein